MCWHLAAVLLHSSDCLSAKLVIYWSQKKNGFESWSSVQCWPSVVLQKKNYPTVLQIIWAMCKYYPFYGMCMGNKSPRLSLRRKHSGIGCLGSLRLCGFWVQYRRHSRTEAHLDKTASRLRSPWITTWLTEEQSATHQLFHSSRLCNQQLHLCFFTEFPAGISGLEMSVWGSEGPHVDQDHCCIWSH